jgi:putative tributyrin esterase
MALININYESKKIGMPVKINAIIPQGRGSYKTLYLLHGMGGDYTTWITKSRVADYVDNTDIAVIMISGDNKCYVDNVHGRKYFTFLTMYGSSVTTILFLPLFIGSILVTALTFILALPVR